MEQTHKTDFMALHDAEAKSIEKETNLISQFETEAEHKARAAQDAITKA